MYIGKRMNQAVVQLMSYSGLWNMKPEHLSGCTARCGARRCHLQSVVLSTAGASRITYLMVPYS